MINSTALRAAIRATSAFRDISEANVTFLIKSGEVRSFDAGSIVVAQGNSSDSVILLLSGEVIVTADSSAASFPFDAPRALSGWRNGRGCAIEAHSERARGVAR